MTVVSFKEAQSKFELTAYHPSGSGKRWKTNASSHEEVEARFKTLRKDYPDYHIQVHHTNTGMVHSFKPHEPYNLNYLT